MTDEPTKSTDQYSPEETDAGVREAWERAEWLSEIVNRRIAELPYDPVEQEFRDGWEPGAYARWQRRKVERLLHAELVEGRYVIYAVNIGFRPDEIARIHPDYLVEFELDSANDAAQIPNGGLRNIRLGLSGESASTSDVVAGAARKPGRPSKRSEIENAIEQCAADAGWFDKKPDERFRAYQAHIKLRYGIDTSKSKGFDDKTFEKYETIYRRDYLR